MTDSNDPLTSLFALTLNLDQSSLDDATSPKNTEAWDSLANMLLIAAIEDTYEIELTTNEIESMKDIGSVRKVLQQRKVYSD